MEKEAIFETLKNVKAELYNRGVNSISVFGSVARGQYNDDSDLDILVSFCKPVGLFEFIRLKAYLEKLTNRRVDLVTIDALRPEMKDQILQESVHVH